MLQILLVTLLVTFCQSQDIRRELDPQWEEFKRTFSKSYYSLDELYRRKVWEDNVDYINRHNLEADMGLHSYRLGINDFADLTHGEFQELYASGGMNMTFTQNEASQDVYEVPSGVSLPSSVDWGAQGYVTPVRNQGSCGSCWAFAAVAAVESHVFKKTGKLLHLSEQNLLDCSRDNNGCNGGWKERAFDYIIRNGINYRSDYPYEGVQRYCRFNSNRVAAKITNYYRLPSHNENALQSAVANIGPVSVSIDASSRAFQLYKSGVYDDTNCRNTHSTHLVVVTGYGTLNGKDYWLVKNSWGTSWGEKGYIKMRRNYGNLCAIATWPTYPIV